MTTIYLKTIYQRTIEIANGSEPTLAHYMQAGDEWQAAVFANLEDINDRVKEIYSQLNPTIYTARPIEPLEESPYAP